MWPPRSASRTPSGSGVWQMTPWTSGSADSSWSFATISSRPGASSCSIRHRSPSLSAVFAIERTYQAVPSSSVGTTTASVGTTPSPRSCSAARPTSSRRALATARPSMSFTL